MLAINLTLSCPISSSLNTTVFGYINLMEISILLGDIHLPINVDVDETGGGNDILQESLAKRKRDELKQHQQQEQHLPPTPTHNQLVNLLL